MLGDTPFFTAIGNHEVQVGGSEGCGYHAYKDVFHLPDNGTGGHSEEYYSFDWGNVHFVALDSNAYLQTDTTQKNWLTYDLQHTSQPWKIVFLHTPAYSSGSSGSDPDVQKYLVPIFEANNVNLVFNGHDHDYERTYPIRGGVRTSIENGGIVYITNGGGGAYTEPISTPSWFTAQTPDHETNEFVNVIVNDCLLQINAIKINGGSLDSYEINRCTPPTPTLTPTQTAPGSITPSATPSSTPSATNTSTATRTHTPTGTSTSTGTNTQTGTNTPTTTQSPTTTQTETRTATPTRTLTPTRTITPSATRSNTPTRTNTPTPKRYIIYVPYICY
jgi:hypothetical protein